MRVNRPTLPIFGTIIKGKNERANIFLKSNIANKTKE